MRNRMNPRAVIDSLALAILLVLALARPAPGPGGLRRPLWLPRAFQPDVSTYRLEP